LWYCCTVPWSHVEGSKMSLVAGCGLGMLYSSSAYFIHEGDTQKGFGLGGMLLFSLAS
jgi:hypothetical protein